MQWTKMRVSSTSTYAFNLHAKICQMISVFVWVLSQNISHLSLFFFMYYLHMEGCQRTLWLSERGSGNAASNILTLDPATLKTERNISQSPRAACPGKEEEKRNNCNCSGCTEGKKKIKSLWFHLLSLRSTLENEREKFVTVKVFERSTKSVIVWYSAG